MYHVPIAAFHVKQEFYDNKKRYILPTDPKIVVLPATYVRFFLNFVKGNPIIYFKKD